MGDAEASSGSRQRRISAAKATCAALAVFIVGSDLASPGHEAVAQGASATLGERPNVVVVMTDDQELASLSVMRHVHQQLAAHGTTFERFFASYPLCCPSRATYLTGQYAHNHGVLSNGGASGGYDAFDDSRTLPVSMRRAGYRTAYVGKYLNGYGPGDADDVPPGWDEWFAVVGDPYAMFDYSISVDGRLREYGSRNRDYKTDVLAERATRFIGGAAGSARPFFLTVAFVAPHTDPGGGAHNPEPAPRHQGIFQDKALPQPPSFNEQDLSDKPKFVQQRPLLDAEARKRLTRKYRSRLETLLSVDEGIAKMLDKLRAQGELDNTLVLFTSDNGYLLGEHRLMGKPRVYEEAIRVPLIMRGPGVPEGAVRQQITGNIDLAPTILDVADAEPGRLLDGLSLIPLAQDDGLAASRDILIELLGRRKIRGVRDSRFMYVRHASGETELYDLVADPFQLDSMHVGGPAFVGLGTEQQSEVMDTQEGLAQRVQELRNCAGDSCR